MAVGRLLQAIAPALLEPTDTDAVEDDEQPWEPICFFERDQQTPFSADGFRGIIGSPFGSEHLLGTIEDRYAQVESYLRKNEEREG